MNKKFENPRIEMAVSPDGSEVYLSFDDNSLDAMIEWQHGLDRSSIS